MAPVDLIPVPPSLQKERGRFAPAEVHVTMYPNRVKHYANGSFSLVDPAIVQPANHTTEEVRTVEKGQPHPIYCIFTLLVRLITAAGAWHPIHSKLNSQELSGDVLSDPLRGLPVS